MRNKIKQIDIQKERHFCIKQLKKTRREFYNYLNVKSITDKKLIRGEFRTQSNL